MRVAGIVSEYNPFHNGHLLHAAATRDAGATHLVAVMSGSFVQRGEAAIADKFLRAEAAVRSGVDLVLELPVPWAVGGAESFARGAVGVLSSFGVDSLSFGCETPDASLLRETADALQNEPLQQTSAQNMKAGLSYPAAVQQALCAQGGERFAEVLQSPNNTLAVEYIKAANALDASFELLPIQRRGAGHDATDAADGVASGIAVRAMNMADRRRFMPEQSFNVYANNPGRLLEKAAYETAVLTALRLLRESDFLSFVDNSSGLCDRLTAAVRTAASLAELLETAKTKSVTLARVRRAVMHLFLQIPMDADKGEPPYLRVLAANGRGLELLGRDCVKKPLVTKHAELASLPQPCRDLYRLQCRASDLYALCTKEKRDCRTEQTTSMLIIRPEKQ